MSSFGQEEKTDLGSGWSSMGSGFAVHDPLAGVDRAAGLRAELATLETQIRDLQGRHAALREQLDRLEAEEAA